MGPVPDPTLPQAPTSSDPADPAQGLAMTPLPHQQRVADTLKHAPGQLAYFGVGTGKSLTAINAAHQNKLPLLAIVPAPLRPNMLKEIHNSRFANPYQIVSYQEALNRMDDPEFLDFASKSLVAYDEAHRAGSVDSQRKDLFKFLPAQKRLLLTGTPARNYPHEVAPLINAVKPGALPENPDLFNSMYLEKIEHPVSFAGRAKDGAPVRYKPKNLADFHRAIRDKVDFYQAADRTHFPSVSESIVEVPMSGVQQDTYDFVTGKYPALGFKMRHGLPMDRQDQADFEAFLSGPRQVTNHPGSYNASATDEHAAKIQRIADEIQARHRTNPKYRGLAYSSFLESGIHPLSRELDRRGIAHAVFTGEQDDNERRAIVNRFNTGQTPVLLISGAGAEGLDLKGVTHVSIAEPHWHLPQIDQVIGRAVRYKSHEHLPENERHVEVQRFHAVPRPTWWQRLLGYRRGSGHSADEYVYQQAQAKRETLEPFLRVMRGEDGAAVQRDVDAKFAEAALNPVFVVKVASGAPGLLVDLDGTIVGTKNWTPGPTPPGRQFPLPGRAEVLQKYRDAGYRIIGITNRHCYSADHTPQKLHQEIQEACGLFPGLLDDVFYCPDPASTLRKPSPAMIHHAVQQHGLDPARLAFVGDAPEDRAAAAAAGIPYQHPDEFFAPQHVVGSLHQQAAKTASAERLWSAVDNEYYGVLPFFSAEQASAFAEPLKVAGLDVVATGAAVLIRGAAPVAASIDEVYRVGIAAGA